MEDLRRIAFVTVLRACGFASLAIFCVMVGLSFEPRLSFRTGGMLMLLMVGILVFKARDAYRRPYRRTEMWLYLPKDLRPPEHSAQQTIAVVMREAYLTLAYWSAALAALMLSIAFVLSLFGN